MKKPKNKFPFIKDYLVTVDYGSSKGKMCYLFLKSTKIKVMDFLSKQGIGEATQNISFQEIGKTKYDDIFWFVINNE